MISLEQILALSAGRLANSEAVPPGAQGRSVSRMAPLRGSTASDLCFFFSKEYQHEIPAAKPGILVTGDAFVEPLRASGLPIWKETLIVACSDPYLAMARISGKFAEILEGAGASGSAGPAVHPTAVVDSSARLASGVVVGPHCVVEAGVEIGERTRLVAGVFLGRGSKLGCDGILFPNVTIYPGCRVGDRVRVHASSVIGSDGFGYAPDRREGQVFRHEKIHHFGSVIIGNDVEIGACSAVDRGTLEDTVIEDMVKIDNFVQVAHNSVLRQGAILCGCSGVAGGSVVGRFAVLGGRATVVNKAEIGDGAQLGAGSLVTKDVPAGEQVAGMPHRPLREHLRIQARLNRLLEEKK